MIDMRDNKKTIYMDSATFDTYRRINEGKSSKKAIKEAYIGEEDEEQMMDGEMYGDEGAMSEETVDYVNQIRQLALNGIQQYGQDVDTEEYDFFKKVWLMCDKVMSNKEGQKE